jgi:quercetin dioxygenase-like cupin family protein
MSGHAADVAPHVYKVLFENDRMRLLEVNLESGASSELHSHPDYLIYALSGGTVHLADGSGHGADVEINAGDVMWRDAEEHTARSLSDGALRALFFELK